MDPLPDEIVIVVPEVKNVIVNPAENIVSVNRTENSVSVSAPGPQGPPGPAGSGGGGGGTVIEFSTAGSPMNPWVINHNLGRLVSVTIVGDDGFERFASVTQVAPYNLVTIAFGNPFSGKALVE